MRHRLLRPALRLSSQQQLKQPSSAAVIMQRASVSHATRSSLPEHPSSTSPPPSQPLLQRRTPRATRRAAWADEEDAEHNPAVRASPGDGDAPLTSAHTSEARPPLPNSKPLHSARRPSAAAQQRRRPSATAVSSANLLQSLEAQHSPFASTLRKQLSPRHTGPHGAVADRHSAHQTDEQRRAAGALRADEASADRTGGYDPALVVHTDSRRRQVRLNAVQREMIWTARREQYQGLLLRVVACLQSHRSPVEKCQTLFALHDEAIRHRLRLRADTYEDIFHTLYSVGVRRGGGSGQPGKTTISPSAQLVGGDAQWDGDVSGHDAAAASGTSLPAELATPSAASSTVLSTHGIEHVWEMYRYSVDSGTDPTARVLQYVMGLLEHASVALAVSRRPATEAANTEGGRRARSSGLLLVEAKAHSLMMDADRFHLTPSEYTINSYIAICEACDVMHLAVARVTDYQTRHERQASAGMYARLITGLVRCGHYEDAMAVVTTMQNVAMSTYLLNAVLQAARHSRDPTSVFTFYRSVFFAPASPLRVESAREGRHNDQQQQQRRAESSTRSSTGLAPSLVTFSIMVEVMQLTGRCTELDFVLAEMRHYRVKGNGMLLNKLLALMEESGKPRKEREALRRAMDQKHIRVFDEHREPSPLLSS